MRDLHERFHRADEIPTPDLSPEIGARASRPEDHGVVVLDRARPRGRTLVAVAAAFTLLAGAVAGSMVLRGEDGVVRATGDASWLTSDGSAMSCAEGFTPENLARRSWAFEGTIVDVVSPVDVESPNPDDQVTFVTFRVNHWYAGGPGETVTVKTSNVPGSTTMNGDADPSIGARLLASGEDGFLWGCGFTMPYAEQDAAVFQAAFGG